MQERVFLKLFEQASIARFDSAERYDYERSISAYRDIKNSIDTAKAEGREEGVEEGLAKGRNERSVEIAQTMLALNIPIEQVAQATGLSADALRSM